MTHEYRTQNYHIYPDTNYGEINRMTQEKTLTKLFNKSLRLFHSGLVHANDEAPLRILEIKKG